jgi:hypothetical protein
VGAARDPGALGGWAYVHHLDLRRVGGPGHRGGTGWATESRTSAKRATADTSADWVTPTGPILPDDPGAAGRYPVQIRDYVLGDEAITLPALGERSELRGRLYLPSGATGKRLVVLFLHGNHAYCYGTPTGDGDKPCPCVEGTKPVPNYLGYDAMGRNLAIAATWSARSAPTPRAEVTARGARDGRCTRPRSLLRPGFRRPTTPSTRPGPPG